MVRSKTFCSASGTTVILAQGFNPETRITSMTKVPEARPFYTFLFAFLNDRKMGMFAITAVPKVLLKLAFVFNHGINSVAKIRVVPLALLFILSVKSLRTE